MEKKKRFAISPTREEDFPLWYQEVIKNADLAEHSPVRGCMVIKPLGYALWENIQRKLDQKIKKKGAKNAYFPLFIPLSYFEKEAQHIEGFATECAVVTHHKLEKNAEGKLVPAGELEEPLIVRPTSEMIIGEMFAKWISSYRDLPLKLNQWANVVRWELRPRLFLRSCEFLWQEGHTAHATKEEANDFAKEILDLYVNFSENTLAVPVFKGRKSEREKFPGAEITYTHEAMMQDGKALQMGTSHFLGQHFSKAADIQFTDTDGELKHAWTTSWGVTTRYIGSLLMVHSDDDGVILPPKIASIHMVIIPIIHKDETREKVLSYCKKVKETLESIDYHGAPLEIHIDTRDMRGGEKSWDWIKKGIPLRLEIGPKEIDENLLFMKSRIKAHKDGEKLSLDQLEERIVGDLDQMQITLFQRAKSYKETMTFEVSSEKEFYDFFHSDKKGFVLAHFCQDLKLEEKIQKELNVTVRCIPEKMSKPGKCIFTGNKSPQMVVFAKSY